MIAYIEINILSPWLPLPLPKACENKKKEQIFDITNGWKIQNREEDSNFKDTRNLIL